MRKTLSLVSAVATAAFMISQMPVTAYAAPTSSDLERRTEEFLIGGNSRPLRDCGGGVYCENLKYWGYTTPENTNPPGSIPATLLVTGLVAGQSVYGSVWDNIDYGPWWSTCDTGAGGRTEDAGIQKFAVGQFVDAAGRVVPIEGGGILGMNGFPLMNMREGVRVPSGAVALYGSYADDQYHDNWGYCHGYMNTFPRGYLESVTYRPSIGKYVATGWACDYSNPNEPIDVHVYNGALGAGGTLLAGGNANISRPDLSLNRVCGGTSPAHAYEIPLNLTPGTWTLYAYGINISPNAGHAWNGGPNPKLEQSPLTVVVPGPAPAPVAPPPPSLPPPAPVAQCSDGVDNDGDGRTDMNDPGCSSPSDNNERDEQTQHTPIGAFDFISADGYAVGWTCDQDSNGARNVHFYEGKDAYHGGTLLGGVVANLPRENAVTQLCGDGFHGFSFRIPDWLRDGQPHWIYAHAINVDASGSWNPTLDNPYLPGSPRVFQFTFPPVSSSSSSSVASSSSSSSSSSPSTGRAIVGSFDGFDAFGNAIGWGCDADNFGLPVAVHLYMNNNAYNGGFLTQGGWAAVPRETAVANFCGGNPAHGFSFRMPDSLRDGQPHLIYAHGIDINASGQSTANAGNSATYATNRNEVTPNNSSTFGCSNGRDDDSDGRIDSADSDCHTDGNASNSASFSANRSETSLLSGIGFNCANGLDDDNDGLTDATDPDCHTDGSYNPVIPPPRIFQFGGSSSSSSSSSAAPLCNDGQDNDHDGQTDSQDPDCHTDGNPYNPGSYNPGGSENNFYVAQCVDRRDNDNDGKTDTVDPGCHTDGNVNNPASFNPSDNDETDQSSSGEANLTITKTASPNPVVRDQNVTFTLQVRNTSTTTTATNVKVTDDLQGGLSYISANVTNGNCSVNGVTVTCSLGNMAPGELRTVYIIAKVPTILPCLINALIYNTGFVSADTRDPVISDNQSQMTLTVLCGGATTFDVSINKAGPATAVRGQPITYTVTVTNNSTVAATNVVVRDVIPGDLIYQSANGAVCSWSHFILTCTMADTTIAPGTSKTMYLYFTVTQVNGGCYPGFLVRNTATVTTTPTDTNAGNNESTATTEILCQ